MLNGNPKMPHLLYFGHKKFPQNNSSITFKSLLMQDIRKKVKRENGVTDIWVDGWMDRAEFMKFKNLPSLSGIFVKN